MNTARKDCIWFDQCGDQCHSQCDDYWSKEFEESESEREYTRHLNEMQEDYMEVVKDYSDGRSEM